jgi:hypothetical protein
MSVRFLQKNELTPRHEARKVFPDTEEENGVLVPEPLLDQLAALSNFRAKSVSEM